MDYFRYEAWQVESSMIFWSLYVDRELPRSLLRLQVEESIADLVPVDQKSLNDARQHWLGERSLEDLPFDSRSWSEADLTSHLHRPVALQRFAEQRFGPGLEESFLGTHGSRDQIVYSLIRCRDAGLLREIWIRLEEGEIPSC